MAQCYRKEGNYQQALEYYNKVEQVQPDNLNLTLQIGQCLMALERYDEALAYFLKWNIWIKTTECPTRHRMVFLHYRQPSTSQEILRLADIRAQTHYGRLDECRTCVLYPE